MNHREIYVFDKDFLPEVPTLGEQKSMKKMKTREENYAAFERLMNREKVYLEAGLTFEEICGRIGTRKDALESVLLEELGMRGDAILDKYRETTVP